MYVVPGDSGQGGIGIYKTVILQEEGTLKGMFNQSPVIIRFIGGSPQFFSGDFLSVQWKLPLIKFVFFTGTTFFQPKTLYPELIIAIHILIKNGLFYTQNSV
jgi:hypothetical protein